MKRRARRPKPRLTVAVTDARGRKTTAVDARGLGPWLASVAPATKRLRERFPGWSVTIAIVSDAQMRRLTREFRGKNRPTDVLSLPLSPHTTPGKIPGVVLGDIAIARGVAGRQARALGHPIRTEFRVLALHGLLHLLGYDHETDRGQMGRLEDRLRRRAGLPAGLISRD